MKLTSTGTDMSLRNDFYLVILGLAAQLFLFGPVLVKPLQATDSTLGQELSLSAGVPEKDHLTLVSTFLMVGGGGLLGVAAEYDDPTTERPADYLELYTGEGDLLAFGWFDQFGIQWTAVDRGLLEDAGELEGVFVIVLDGDAV